VELNIVNANFDIVEMFDKMIWHLDEPQADAAPLNVLKIAGLARDQGIKVLIGGTAGDDLFSGYRRHQALNIEKYIKLLPTFFVRLVQGSVKLLPSHFPMFRRLKKVVSNLHETPIERQLSYFSWLPENTVHSLFSADWKEHIKSHDPFEYFYKVGNDLDKHVSDLDRMLFWELKTFLVDHNLNYTDKLGMAVGVEARVPFLDLDLVEFSQSIPQSMKMRGKETKYILKKVAERYLPLDVIYRPKTGFGAPVRKWITSDLQPMINERLSIDRIKARGIFNPEAVWNLIDQNKTGKIDASYSIWALLAIESWCMQFVDGIELYKVKNKAK
jgi:asparagine synthase (glutamine-hydrolysing)